jgi:hypothetical protein
MAAPRAKEQCPTEGAVFNRLKQQLPDLSRALLVTLRCERRRLDALVTSINSRRFATSAGQI